MLDEQTDEESESAARRGPGSATLRKDGSRKGTAEMLASVLRLPVPHTLAELEAHTPRIAPVSKGTHRPRWSVMIPTYSHSHFLPRTLESVLAQDPGPEAMQIEVVDACSASGDAKRIVEELGRGRVTFHRLSSNHGPAHTFNACIERSSGHWIHILHDDDAVLPGFYSAYAAVMRACPEARTVVGQVVVVDESDRWTGVSGLLPPPGGGIVSDFTDRMVSQQLAQFPAVVVHRDAYEAAGGFCTLFTHAPDWDMWFRLGLFAPVACVAHPCARYRVHEGSETSRVIATGANMRETYLVIRSNLARLGGLASRIDERAWRAFWASKCQTAAWLLGNRGNTTGRYNQLRWALMLEPTLERWLAVSKAWATQKLRGRSGTPGERAA
jgi:cellulose synthase/poly-beta-1,6-N-acetylglucosamine synthase-like glycosyltransferase